MRKQTILILSILAIGILSSTAYAASTIITDTSISTTNLTVTGTCTGCGAGEGSFTNYNTVLLNTTVGSSGDNAFPLVQISNSANVAFSGTTNNYYVNSTGTTLFINSTIGSGSVNHEISQSSTGEYSILINDNFPKISIFKNGIYLQDLGINLSQFSNPFGKMGIAISPDGKYITVVGLDSGVSSDRLLIFRGS